MEEDFTISTLDENVSVISQLSDLPNVTDRLTATQLKAKFDEGNEKIKTYINDTMIPELEEHINDNLATKEEIQGIVLGEIPDGTLTSDKFTSTIKDGIEGSQYIYKIMQTTIDEDTSTSTDLYIINANLHTSSLVDNQKVVIHTPDFEDTVVHFYLNTIPVSNKLLPNMDYELVYYNGTFKPSTFEEVILRRLKFVTLDFSPGQHTIIEDGKCISVFWAAENKYYFKEKEFTYDELTNKTTFVNPQMGQYVGEDARAYGIGLFIE